ALRIPGNGIAACQRLPGAKRLELGLQLLQAPPRMLVLIALRRPQTLDQRIEPPLQTGGIGQHAPQPPIQPDQTLPTLQGLPLSALTQPMRQSAQLLTLAAQPIPR